MNAIEVLIDASNAAQRAAIEARDTLASAERTVLKAKQAVADAEAVVEFLSKVLREQS